MLPFPAAIAAPFVRSWWLGSPACSQQVGGPLVYCVVSPMILHMRDLSLALDPLAMRLASGDELFIRRGLGRGDDDLGPLVFKPRYAVERFVEFALQFLFSDHAVGSIVRLSLGSCLWRGRLLRSFDRNRAAADQ